MSAPRKPKTTVNPSTKRCRALSPNCTPSSPSPRNWRRPSQRTCAGWDMSNNARTTTTIEELIASGAIVAHKDGNYGSNYPRVEEFGLDGVPFLTAKSLRDGYVDIASAPRLADARADELR